MNVRFISPSRPSACPAFCVRVFFTDSFNFYNSCVSLYCRVLRRFLHSDMTGSPVPAPFTRRKFIAHCQQLADNPGKLSNEYQLLQTLSVDLQMPTNAACLQANRKKNRYTDILPCEFDRFISFEISVTIQIKFHRDCARKKLLKILFLDDFSRVKLEVIDNDPNTDYINASFIKVRPLILIIKPIGFFLFFHLY